MNTDMRAMVDAMKAGMLQGVPELRKANEMIPITGKRGLIELAGRTVPYAFYSAAQPGRPLILGFHGGGFLFGGSCMDDAMWHEVAMQLNVNIASIDYRKAPDYMWPAPIEDACEAACWFRENGASMGIDTERISVMGSSAGANVAAAVCLYAKEHSGVMFDYQILMYPWLDLKTDPALKGEGSLDAPMFYVFNELYVKPEDAGHRYCSPVFATHEELTGLPQAIICVAENDSLKPEGQRYAQKLSEAGVCVSLASPASEMPHGYFEYGFGTAMGQDFLAEDVKNKIADGSIAREAQSSLDFIKEHFYC